MSNNQKNAKTTKNLKGISALLSPNGSTALSSYLENTAARRHTPVQKSDSIFLARLPRLASIGDDGVNHINVSSHGRTDIGKVFSLGDGMPYFDKLLGIEVAHLRAFNNFMLQGMTKPETLFRSRLGAQPIYGQYKHMVAFMAHAIRSKLDHYEPLRTLLSELAVPLDWYLLSSGNRRVRNDIGVGYVQALIEYQRAMRQPNLPFQLWKFLDHEESLRIRKLPEAKREQATLDVLAAELAPAMPAIKDLIQARADKAQAKDKAAAQKAEPAAPALKPITTSEELDAAAVAGELGTVAGWGGAKRTIAKESIAEQPPEVAIEDLDLVKKVAAKAGDDADLLAQIGDVADISGNDAAQ